MPDFYRTARPAQPSFTRVGILYWPGSGQDSPSDALLFRNTFGESRPTRSIVGRRGALAVQEILAIRGIPSELRAFEPGLTRKEDLRDFRFVLDLTSADIPNPDESAAGLLDELGIPHSGAPAAVLRIVRDAAALRGRMAAGGVAMPPGQVVDSDLSGAEIQFPAVVSPVRQDGCAQNDHHPYWIAVDRTGLKARLDHIQRTCGQSGLVQTFLPGGDVVMPVINRQQGPTPLPAVRYDHLSGQCQNYLSHAARWQAGRTEEGCCFPRVTLEIDLPDPQALRRAAVSAFQHAGCRDYAWMYFRLVGETPYRVAINAAPPLTWRSPVCQATTQAAGMNFNGLVNAVLDSASRQGA